MDRNSQCTLSVTLPNSQIIDITTYINSTMNSLIDYIRHKYPEYKELYLTNNGKSVDIHEKISHFLESTKNQSRFLIISTKEPISEPLNFILKVPNLQTKAFGPFYPFVTLESIKEMLISDYDIVSITFTKYDGTLINDEDLPNITLKDLNLTIDFPLFATGTKQISIKNHIYEIPFSITRQELLSYISCDFPLLLSEDVINNDSIFLVDNNTLVQEINEKIQKYYPD